MSSMPQDANLCQPILWCYTRVLSFTQIQQGPVVQPETRSAETSGCSLAAQYGFESRPGHDMFTLTGILRKERFSLCFRTSDRFHGCPLSDKPHSLAECLRTWAPRRDDHWRHSVAAAFSGCGKTQPEDRRLRAARLQREVRDRVRRHGFDPDLLDLEAARLIEHLVSAEPQLADVSAAATGDAA
jgi:hypothetical protein